MHWKFNPPPGWPQQPDGWVPPPGWEPDPSWPPAPANWEFWVPAQSAPGHGPVAASPPPAAAPPPTSTPPTSTPPTAAPPQATVRLQAAAPPPTSTPPAAYPPGPYPPVLAQPPATAKVPMFHRWWVFLLLALVCLVIGCVGGVIVGLLVS